MVTDSADSADVATDVSISRRSGRFSAQKAASASSLPKRGTSSHTGIAFMANPFRSFRLGLPLQFRATPAPLLRERLVQLTLVEELFLRIKGPGVNDPDLLP